MFSGQQIFLVFFLIFNLFLGIYGFWQTYKKKNAFGEVQTGPLGIYVWGDAVVFGIFWAGAAFASLIMQDWILFWLIFSVFWLVRSIGETIYWLNEQHASKKRVDIEKKLLYKYFHNDSVLFVYQITHQCITVITIITSLYLGKLWLGQF